MIGTIRRRLRSRTPVAASFAAPILFIAFLFATNSFMDAQSLTPAQNADAELGSASAALTMFDVDLRAGTDDGDRLRDAFESQSPRFGMALNVIDFPLFRGGLDGVYYTEKDWDRSPPTRQFSLTNGRWPREAGEVVVAGAGSTGVRVGDEVPTAGAAPDLRIVGLARTELDRWPKLLAGPGTWRRLAEVRGSDGAPLRAFPTFETTQDDAAALIEGINRAVGSTVRAVSGEGPAISRAAVGERVRTRAELEAEAPRLWTVQSPLSLWIPGLLALPALLVMGYVIVAKRLESSASAAMAQGVKRRDALLAIWLVPLPLIVASTLVAVAGGTTIGYATAFLGEGRWGYSVTNVRVPWAAIEVSAAGVVLGLALGLAALRDRIVVSGRRQLSAGTRSRLRSARHLVGVVCASITLWQVLTLREPSGAMALIGLMALTAAALGPELIDGLLRVMPRRTLTQRLVARQIATNRQRLAVVAGIYIVIVAATVGMLTILSSEVADARERQPVSVPSGDVLLDSFSTPFLKPDPAVVAAVETVPSIKRAEPIQFFLIGKRGVNPSTGTEETIGTRDDRTGVAFAFDSADDLEGALGAALTSADRDLLADGGALVINPDLVRVARGQLALIDKATGRGVATVPVRIVDPAQTRWTQAVPFVMLRATAQGLGMATTPAAMLFKDISAPDRRAARTALRDKGLDPRSIGVYEKPAPIVPPAAIVGSVVLLVALLVGVSVLATRAQVRAMRGWASQLTRVGVRRRWAARAISRQHAWIAALSVGVGASAAVASLAVTGARVQRYDLVIPWTLIGLVIAVVALSTILSGKLASRQLEPTER
ncbi:hypothetical protein KV100_08570 [Mumia sp. zg.B21]|uniref:hypothetical protein n=1 Tax=Mumia sp. zg.B21 TaxID=2855447 RepID=UPI001C6DD875|nr:hypothetical protein [Mumia sp. zg.B21]MBW9209709.1 hypothetical protein [Mumia sp. zg.B21]